MNTKHSSPLTERLSPLAIRFTALLIFLIPTLVTSNALGKDFASAQLPDWLETKGEFRLRYESLDGQFRARTNGSDQLIAARTLAQVNAHFTPISFNFELQDSRTFLDDEGTPLSTSFVNTFEFINANVDLHFGSLLGKGSSSTLKIGRQTVEVGSERFIERNGFRNTINSYDGVHLRTTTKYKNQFETFLFAPVRARPRDADDLANNRRSHDKTDDTTKFGGAVYTNNQQWFHNTTTELFAYGLHEKDTADRATPDRDIYTLGFRTLKNSELKNWDFELEYAYQFGERYQTNDPLDRSELDVRAHTLHAEIAYTFDTHWQPRVAFEFDYASGDDDPNDSRFSSYDRLFGSRRGDVGFTSIHGPLVRNNLVLPGIDVEFKPGPNTDGSISYQRAYLDSARDELDAANLRDISGDAGTFIGDTLDISLRHWVVPKRIRWDIGVSALFNGDFLDNVNNGPSQNRTLYAFTQITAKF